VSLFSPFCDSTQRDVEKFSRILEGDDFEAVLLRLDRLTWDEARMTTVHILEIARGLVQNMRIIMDSEQNSVNLLIHQIFNNYLLDGKASAESVRQALGKSSQKKQAQYLTD
jgi:hypothetical protein